MWSTARACSSFSPSKRTGLIYLSSFDTVTFPQAAEGRPTRSGKGERPGVSRLPTASFVHILYRINALSTSAGPITQGICAS